MMIVFQVKAETATYQSLSLNDFEKDSHVFGLEGKPAEGWETPTFHVYDPRLPRGNFYGLGDSSLIFDSAVHDSMKDLLLTAGEILPVEVDGLDEKVHLLNVLETADCLDRKASKWRKSLDGRDIAVKDFAFMPERISSASSLFKIPELNFLSILTCSGKQDVAHDFHHAYTTANFTGLVFDELWEDTPSFDDD